MKRNVSAVRKYYTTILVVQKDPDDQHFIELGFRKAGVEGPIQLVDNGEEAIAYMKGEGKYSDREKYAYPSFIITDLKMPKADGFAVLEFLKRNPAWAIIPTVVISASDDPDDVKKSYMMGASSYHRKPASFKELQDLLAVLHAYWMKCEVPEVDVTGKQVPTESKGKLSEMYSQGGEADAGRSPN